jgi:hypothetical protein
LIGQLVPLLLLRRNGARVTRHDEANDEKRSEGIGGAKEKKR